MELKDVKELIDFDKETVKKVSDVYDKKALVLKQIAQEKETIKNKTWEEVEAKVKERKAQLDQKIAQDVKVNDAYYTNMAQELKATYDAKKGEWEKELFDRCVK